ncbi:MAG: ectonucleotide pyrophosphatase/phosphodiesterase [Polymorphobacter sp.]
MQIFRIFSAVLVLLLAGCATRPPQTGGRPPVILVSVDGLRPDYLARGVTPNIDALAASGVRAKAMRPSFPSLTFPNHYTLVTGLRPDRHGIVNNSMEDPGIPGVKFALSNRAAVEDRRWWDAAEPVWVTAEKAGLRTATMFWPGSEAAIGGVRPAQWLPFDGALPNPARVAQVLAWLDAPQPPAFLTLYFDTVDHDGHEFGPDAPETTKAMAEVDARIGDLVTGLKARGLAANIVLVSDHGMMNVAPERSIRIDQLLPPGSFRSIAGGAMAALEPMPGREAEFTAALLRPHDHMQCMAKAEVPERLHYGRNVRVPAYLCLAAPGWMIVAAPPRTDGRLGGMHGYDPELPEMAATFVAAGPAFRGGVVLGSFDNVDVYPLLMQLLGLPARASDGDIAPLRKGLR